jgi:CheY-like chemotaxis protein
MPITLTPTSMLLPPYDEDEDEPLRVSYGRDILVVDDHQTNLIAIEAALSPLGRKLVLAHSGVEALGRLLEQDFALIILDVAMPGMDGFETAKLVRSRERNRATPIIFITGLSWENDAVLRGYELGAFDFLMKPIRPEVLRAKATVFVQLQERTFELAVKADELRQAQARAHERELHAQRRRFETEVMERQMQQLAEADRRKDEFLAILAHELRNPLQPLQTAVEVLEHDPDKPVPSRLTRPSWIVTPRSYSSRCCGAPASTTALLVNITRSPGRKIGDTKSRCGSVAICVTLRSASWRRNSP